MSKKYRIKSKLRFTIFVTVCILITVFCLGSIFGADVVSGSTEKQYVTVTVQPGDTLWTIAETYADESVDVRQYAYNIAKFNGISDSTIHVGEEIIVPLV
ncbi:MAG: cell division suppressor protein YneA [Eubacterium sp.]|jgi:cell division protein YceG involved in septum cleavage